MCVCVCVCVCVSMHLWSLSMTDVLLVLLDLQSSLNRFAHAMTEVMKYFGVSILHIWYL